MSGRTVHGHADGRIDNGINIAAGETNYALRTDLSSRIKRVNPNWNEPADDATFDVRIAELANVLLP